MDRNSRAILAKGIKLDKQYKNIVDYTETQMVNLCLANKVYEASNCSIIKNNESLELDVTFTVALQANYIAFENPNYGNKWFFAFIDRVEYISDNATRIYYTVDELSTWRDYWDIKPCFTVREHVNDDTIGLHTVPENIECGDYLINACTNISINADLEPDVTQGETPFFVCFCVTEPPNPSYPTPIAPNIGSEMGSVFTPLIFFAVNTSNGFQQAKTIIDWYRDTHQDTMDKAIVNMYMIPFACVDTVNKQTWTKDNTSVTVYAIKPSNKIDLDLDYIFEDTYLSGFYTPRNKKLLTYPYCYLYLDNKAGENAIFRWEDGKRVNMGTEANPNYRYAYGFSITIVPSAGVSAKLFPLDYKTMSEPSAYYGAYNYGINFGKVPVCAWTNDYYTNWLTQNGVNVATKVGIGVASLGLGLATGGIGLVAGAVSGVTSVASAVSEFRSADKVPPQASGSVNTGDVTFAYTFNNISCYRMTIRKEYAEIIDDYFDRQGYKVNRLKVPNETGRTYWNYIQIANDDCIGTTKNTISVPTSSMDIINNAYRSGVTIWHDHANIGDYSLSNTIVTP